jgi:hypothetical protein
VTDQGCCPGGGEHFAPLRRLCILGLRLTLPGLPGFPCAGGWVRNWRGAAARPAGSAMFERGGGNARRCFPGSDRYLQGIHGRSPLFKGRVTAGCAGVTRTSNDWALVTPGGRPAGAAGRRIGNTERSRCS